MELSRHHKPQASCSGCDRRSITARFRTLFHQRVPSVDTSSRRKLAGDPQANIFWEPDQDAQVSGTCEKLWLWVGRWNVFLSTSLVSFSSEERPPRRSFRKLHLFAKVVHASSTSLLPGAREQLALLPWWRRWDCTVTQWAPVKTDFASSSKLCEQQVASAGSQREKCGTAFPPRLLPRTKGHCADVRQRGRLGGDMCLFQVGSSRCTSRRSSGK